MREMMVKKSQVTIFVIIAIVIIVAIAGAFILIKKTGTTSLSINENPKAYMENCMKKASEEALKKIIPVGGLLNQDKSFLFNKQKVIFLCYTMLNRELCTNEHPMLNIEIQNQIISDIKPKVEKCFAEVASSLRDYDYKEIAGELKAEISPNILIIKSDKKITYTKNEEINSISGFNTRVNSALWDFISLSNKIVNQEVNCDCGVNSCNADVLKLSLENPEFEIEHFVAGSEEEVYSIKELLTEQIFNIAIRNCVRGQDSFSGLA